MDPQVQATLDTLNSARNLANGGARWGFDEGKRAYYSVDPSGRVQYQNTNMPGSTTAETKVTGGGLLHARGQWDQRTGQWKTPIDWGKVGSLGVGAILTGGALSAAPAFGGATLGPSTSANIAATAASGQVPAALSTAAGTTAGATGMGLTDILLKYGLPFGSDLLSTGMQARAQGQANTIQQRYYDRALAAAQEEQQYQRRFDEDERGYRRGRISAYGETLKPYAAAGPPAVSRLSRLATQSPYTAGEAMVTLTAPTGQTKAVPESQVERYLKAGATRV